MDSDDSTCAQRRRVPYSLVAGASLALSIPVFVSTGAIGLVLGIVGLWRTHNSRRRGRAMAKWGIGLGAISLLVTLTGWPIVVFSPPLLSEDKKLQGFLDQIAQGRPAEAYDTPGVYRGNLALPQFAEWASIIKGRYGRARVIAVKFRLHGQATWCSYWVHFEKVGIRTVDWYYDVEPDGKTMSWDLSLPGEDVPDLSSADRAELLLEWDRLGH